MRLFLVFVIILNLLYAGWEYLSPSKSVDKIAPLADNLQSLELLREARNPPAESIAEATNNNVSDSVISSEDNAFIEGGRLAVQEPRAVESCYTLGPFKDKDIMLQVRASLAEQVNDLSVRKRAESEKHRYWVYMPSLGSRKKAKLMVKRLQESQVKDFYIILNGNARNGISLGLFKEQLHANRRLKRVTGLGYNAEIEVIYREYDVYWLDYQISPDKAGGVFSVNEYVAEGVSQLVRQCKADS